MNMQEVYCLIAAVGGLAVAGAGYALYKKFFYVPLLTEAEKKAIEDAKATAAALAAGGAAVTDTAKPIEQHIKDLGHQAVGEGVSIEEHEAAIEHIDAAPEPPPEFPSVEVAHEYFDSILHPPKDDKK